MRVPSFVPSGPLAPFRSAWDAVSSILNGGGTLADNMAGEIKTFRWEKDVSELVTLSTSRKQRPTTVVVLGAAPYPQSANEGVVYSGLSIAWRWVGDDKASIQVGAVSLLDDDAWDVTIWIVGV